MQVRDSTPRIAWANDRREFFEAAHVAVVSPAGAVRYVEIGTGRDLDLLSGQCANSVRLLPPAPHEFNSDSSAAGSSPRLSLADELRKLSELRESDALTEAEFQAAKQRLLSQDDP